MTEDEDADDWALVRRGLIAEANRRYWSAEDVEALLKFATDTYDSYILDHPTFPAGVLTAFEVYNRK